MESLKKTAEPAPQRHERRKRPRRLPNRLLMIGGAAGTALAVAFASDVGHAIFHAIARWLGLG